MKKILLVVHLLLWLCIPTQAKRGDEDKPKDGKPNAVIQPLPVAGNDAFEGKAVSFHVQQDLNIALERYKEQQKGNVITYVDKMDNIPAFVSEMAEDDRGTASKLMSFLDQNPDRVKEDIGFEDLTILPVGIKKRLGDQSFVTMGILRAEFKAQYAELTVFVRLQTKINSKSSSIKQRDLFFGIEKLRFTKQGGLSASSFKAVLLGDYLLPFEKWTVKLKGGLDKTETPSDNDPNRCYVEFDCGSFKGANIVADVVVPRSVLLPCTNEGEIIKDEAVRVTATGLRIYTTNGLRDLLFEAGSITPFALPNQDEYAFSVTSLVVDLSDTKKSSSVVFPAGYSGIDTDEKWQGFFIGSFSIILPHEFQDKENEGNRVKIQSLQLQGQNIICDRTGFSGTLSVSGINKKVNASSWTLSLTSFNIQFIQNEFISGSFTGKIETPVHKENEADNKLFEYTALIDLRVIDGIKRSNYTITVTTEKEIPMQLWWAKGKIAPGSQVILSLQQISPKKYKFKPFARLSGVMSIGAKKDGDSVGDYKEDETINFGRIQFYNLTIQTETPYVSIERFAYDAGENNLLGNFPVSITRFQKYEGQIAGNNAPDNELWTEIGFKINLLKDATTGESRFTGASNWVLRSRYDQLSGKLKPVGITVRRIEIKGSITPVSIDGFLDIYEDNARKEIKGSLAVVVTKPKPFEVQLNVLFARDKSAGYKYGFIDGFVEGIEVDLFPGVQLYGAGIGVYWHMKPSPYGSSGSSGDGCTTIGASQILTYCPNPEIPIGIRMMASIQNTGGSAGSGTAAKTIYKARVYLDFALSTTFGINHIAIYGNGVIAGNFLNESSSGTKASYNSMMSLTQNGSNIKEGESDQATSAKKAKLANIAMGSISSFGAPPSGTGVITFSAGFMLDIPSSTFHAELEVYMKAGNLSGIGPGGRMGKAVLHFAPAGNWYVHIGQAAKQNRVGIKYEQGSNPYIYAGLDAYFMIGEGVPQFPAPDKEVIDFFPALKNRFNGPVCTDLSAGKALAFGASAKFSVKGNVSILYYEALAIAGLDVLLSNNSPCVTGSQDADKTWMGQGQLYALVKLKADVKTRWLSFTLLDAGMGLYVYLQGPKPFGFTGQVCVSVPRWFSKSRQSCITLNVGSICSSAGGVCGSNN
ncbi:hypothetical protein [Emticicia sp. 17c]|uniref:hypothetical protein n=1 Tax=Emticicia sp. 17c TaxID=3127704 RepID=UPI00301DEB8A